MLWTCLHFPDLCLQAFQRGAVDASPAAVGSLSNRPDVLACNSRAADLGLAPGMSVAAALALAPDLMIHLRDESAENGALKAIATWAGQFTPTVSIASPHGVLLEVGTTLAYFRGLANLVNRMESGARDLGWDAVLATAPTPAGALLLARAGLQVHTRDGGRLKEHLNALPLAFLENAQPSLDVFHILGISTIEDLLKQPAEGVARRFGQALLDEIRRAAGDLPDPVPIFVPPECYKNRIELPSPVIDCEALLFPLHRLVMELAGFLRARGHGVTRLTVEFVHEDATPTRLAIGLACTRDTEHILRVLRERLRRETLPDRVEAVVLESSEVAPLNSTNQEFFPGAVKAIENHTQLIEKFCARLGEDAVRKLQPREDHRPELAWCHVEIDSPPGKISNAAPAIGAARPLWLLPEPRRLPGNAAAHSLTFVSGPECIEAGWWDGGDLARDYFIAHNTRGETCWIYRDRQGQWFLHGLFA